MFHRKSILAMLQSLNIASCARVTEGGVCAVAVSSSKTLQLLNMTGCERIAASSLEHLLSGLPFCERAETFFGFKAKPNALEQKLKVQQRVINDAAALLLAVGALLTVGSRVGGRVYETTLRSRLSIMRSTKCSD